MDDDGRICTEKTHSFLEHDEVFIVGYQCSSNWLFWGTVVLSFLLVLAQVKIGVADGQASRMALAAKRGSPERKKLLRRILIYTAVSSALSIIHTVLVVGLNLYILLALTAGNIYGVYTSYKKQEADEHCATADICAWLQEAKANPNDDKFIQLRTDLRVFLMLEKSTQGIKATGATEAMELECPARRRLTETTRFEPYRDHPQWKL